LDRLSTEQLREEARRYQLPDNADRRILIDAIMAHFERHAPGDLASHFRDTARSAPSASRTIHEMEADVPITAAATRQVMMSVSDEILRHQRELQNQQFEFLQRQQEQLALLTQVILSSRENVPPSRASREHAAVSDPAGPA